MKNKNLFKESRFVWFAGPPKGPEVHEKSPEEVAIDFMKTKLFKDEKLSPEAYVVAQMYHSEYFDALIDAVIKDENNIPNEIKASALIHLQYYQSRIDANKLKEEVNTIAKTKGDIAKLKEELPVEEDFNDAFGLAPNQAEINTEKVGLNKWWMNVARDTKGVNAEIWKPNTKEGLAAMRADWDKIGVPISSSTTFYSKIFNQLSKSSSPNFLSTLSNDKKAWYLNPVNNLDKLQAEDNEFYKAWKFHESIKEFMVTQDNMQGVTGRKIEDVDKDPIAVQLTDGIKSNVNKFQKAIKERDYATAGVYILGMWAIYKSYKKLSEGNEDKYGKWLAYGAAAYCGNIFLKNAGFDVMKKLGLKDMEADVMGTPLESMGRLNIPEAQDVDYAVYLKTSEVKLSALNNLYENTHHGADLMADGFIDPAQFPNEFPQFRNKSATDKQKDKEYSRVGHELYKIAFCLNRSYEKTLMINPKESFYFGKPFKKALEDGMLKESNVRHFTGVLMEYAPLQYAKSLFEPAELKNARGRFDLAFAGTDMGATIDLAPLDPEKHVVGAMIMNYPVVVVTDPTSKKYRIFTRLDYENNKGIIHQGNALGEVPFTGSASTAVADIRRNITQKMLDQAAPIVSNGGRIIRAINYDNGHWKGEIKVPGAAKYDIAERGGTVELIPRADGRVDLVMTGMPVAINVDYFYDQANPHVGVLFANMVQNDDLATLRPFYNKSKIKFVRELETSKELDGRKPPQFEIEVSGEKVTVGFDAGTKAKPGTKKYSISADDQKRLLKSPGFANEYIKALETDENFELNKTVAKLKTTINHSPEGFWKHLWEKLTFGQKDSPVGGLNLDVFSKSVPDYFSNTVLDVTVYAAQEKLRRRIVKSKTFAEVEAARNETLLDVKVSLDAVYDVLSRENVDKGAWDRDEFVDRVLYPIRAASSKSSSYDLARNKFEYDAYGVVGGVLKSTDLSTAGHGQARDLLNVFSYYTAYLDEPIEDIDAAGNKLKIGLDNLPPPKRKDLTKPIHEDPGLRGHLAINYFEYVRAEILDRVRGKDLKSIPDGNAKSFWGIMEFEEWSEKKGKYTPLDKLDNLGVFLHDVNEHKKPGFTELEFAIRDEFDRTVAYLMNEYPDKLSYPAIHAYLRTKQSETPDDLSKVGLFSLVKTLPGSSNYSSALWDLASPIATLKTRGQQMKEIKKLVNEQLVRHIFENPDVFFIEKPSLTTRARQRWPWLAQYI